MKMSKPKLRNRPWVAALVMAAVAGCARPLPECRPLCGSQDAAPDRGDGGADAGVVDVDAETDAGVVDDAGADSGLRPIAPRPLAPLSTATATSRRPTLHWALPAGMDGARVEMCADRGCTTVLTTIDASDTSVAPAIDLPTGAVFWRLFGRAGTTVSADASPTWELFVGSRGAAIDTSWGTVLDVDGDGHVDLAVGASGAGEGAGAVHVYLGSATGFGTSATATLVGTDPAGAFGASVASAGDVNGDGYADLIVGGFETAHVYLGSASGIGTTPALTLADPDGGSSAFGMSVSSAGDINDDGYGDFAVGDQMAGRAYLYFGGPTSLGSSPAVTLIGPEARGRFGATVASAGDVNGDGYGDFAVGASGSPAPGDLFPGRTYVYLGSESGLDTSAATTLSGPGDGDLFGYAVANAGDLNGDGYADLSVGAWGVSDSTGAAYVYLGGAAGLTSLPTATLTAPDGAGGRFGVAVASAGDLNGDGFADLAVSANAVASFTGRVHVYLGSGPGVGTSAGFTLIGPDGPMGGFGSAVTSLGDVDGDGYGDLAVGAAGAASNVGGVHIFEGGEAGLGPSPTATLTGPDGTDGQFGHSLASAGRPLLMERGPGVEHPQARLA